MKENQKYVLSLLIQFMDIPLKASKFERKTIESLCSRTSKSPNPRLNKQTDQSKRVTKMEALFLANFIDVPPKAVSGGKQKAAKTTGKLLKVSMQEHQRAQNLDQTNKLTDQSNFLK